MSVMDDAQILWDYHQMHHKPRNTDIAIGLGSHDIGVAEHTAALYRQGRFPLIVFTGANAPTTVDVFPRGEAVHYAERAIELGVPEGAILIEPQARNTGENFTLTHQLLDRRGIHPTSATIISRPYQQRRAYATCLKLWPQLDVVCSSRALSLSDYITSIGDEDKVLNMLVGDTQRIWVYADRGFSAPQAMTEDVLAAYQRLVQAGYRARLTDLNGNSANSRTWVLTEPLPPVLTPVSESSSTILEASRDVSAAAPVGTSNLSGQGIRHPAPKEGTDEMSVTLSDPGLYQRIEVSELAEAMLSVFRCSGIEPGGVTYVSTPITTGELLIRWYEEHGTNAGTPDIRSAVIETNLATVQPLIDRVRRTTQAPVVEPVSMMDIPGWSQPDYHSFWCAFIERFSNRVVFNEGWHFSNGCAAEFATAALSGHELLDHDLAPMSVSEGIDLIKGGLPRLESVGLDTRLLRRAAKAASSA